MGTDPREALVTPDETGLPRDVYALLAQANLLRMRGCWEEAVLNCMAALRLAPDSPSAQSLLGDIYENQGRYDDAVQWYRMALDVNPDSPADQMKLDRLVRLQQESAPRSQFPAMAHPSSAALASTQRRLLLNPEAALRYAALTAALLVLLIVVFAYAAVHRQAALSSLGLGTDQEVKTHPVVVSSVSGPEAGAAAQGSVRDRAEQAMLDSLRASSDLTTQGITILDVQDDPRSATVGLTFGLMPSASLSHETVLRAALRTIHVAALAPGGQGATVYTARCLETSAENSTDGASLVFIGDLPRSSLPANAAADAGMNAVQMQALFGNLWWSSQISA